tara:strand:- start:2796 stop:3224 length:429 start_codon:yes stop_codon:yes gene_type:complete
MSLTILPVTHCDDDRIEVESIPSSEKAYVSVSDDNDSVTLFLPRGEPGPAGRDGTNGNDGKDATAVPQFLNSPRLSVLEDQVAYLTELVHSLRKENKREVESLWATPITLAFRIDDGEITERRITIRELREKRFVLQLSLKE